MQRYHEMEDYKKESVRPITQHFCNLFHLIITILFQIATFYLLISNIFTIIRLQFRFLGVFILKFGFLRLKKDAILEIV